MLHGTTAINFAMIVLLQNYSASNMANLATFSSLFIGDQDKLHSYRISELL